MQRAVLHITLNVEADDLAGLGAKTAAVKTACKEAGHLGRWVERTLTARQRPQAATTARAQDGALGEDPGDAMEEAAAVNEAAAT